MAPLPALSAKVEELWRPRRERAAELQARMLKNSRIYNAAYMVRHRYFMRDANRQASVDQFIAVVLEELSKTADPEACLFAIADALYCSPHGVPWEA